MILNEYIKSTKLFVGFLFAYSMIIPLLAPFLKLEEFSDAEISFAFSFMSLSLIILSPILGRISDRIGRNQIIYIGIIFQIISITLYLFGDNLLTLILARVAAGIAFAGVVLVGIAKVEDSLDNKNRGKFTGLSLSLEAAGKIFAPLFAGFLADYFFIEIPFFVSILILIYFLASLKSSSIIESVKIQKSDFSWIDEIKRFISNPKLRAVGILGFAKHSSEPAAKIFLPLYILENLGLDYTSIGIAFFVLILPHISQYYFGSWADKDTVTSTLVGIIISGFSLILISFVQDFNQLLIVLFIYGLGNSIWNVSAWTHMSNIGEQIKNEGEVLGAYFSISKIGAFISFAISGILADKFGLEILFIFYGGLTILSSVIATPFFRNKI